MSSQVVLSAAEFTKSIGVNTHTGVSTAYDNAALISDDLAYLGVTKVRDNLSSDASAEPVEAALAADGYKFDFVVSSTLPASGSSGLAKYITQLNAFDAAHPGSIIAVEGLNEEDIQSFSYDGSSTTQAAIAYQAALYKSVKSDSTLSIVSVYNFTISDYNNSTQSASVSGSASTDYSNAHAYVSTSTTPQAALSRSLALSSEMTGGEPNVITETGYSTFAGTSVLDVDQTVQAKSILDTLLDAYKDGVSSTYLYELFDEDNISSSNEQAHFGLFNADGTPKLAATAIHNLTSILADDGTGTAQTAATLNHSLTNLPSSGSSMVLGKTNGAYDIVLWPEPKLWNSTTGQDVTTASQTVSVDFGTVYSSVKVYDPLLGTNPIAVYSNVRTLKVSVSDHPIVIEVTQTSISTASLSNASTLAALSGTAATIVTELSALNSEPALKSITLTDKNVLSVASAATMTYMISHYQHALSAIQGNYDFAVTTSDTNWAKTILYDSTGTLVSTQQTAYSNGVATSSLTTYASGKTDAITYTAGIKTGEVVTSADSTRAAYSFNITGQSYASAEADYDVSGKMTAYITRYPSGNVHMNETFLSSGAKAVTYFTNAGVTTSDQYLGVDGSVSTGVYTRGIKTAEYVTNADKSQDNYFYNVAGKNYSTKHLHISSSSLITGTYLYDASNNLTYSKLVNSDGTYSVINYSAVGADKRTYTSSGVISRDVVTNNDGSVSTSVYTSGVKTKMYVVHADKTQDNYFYNITGQSCTSEHDHIKASGATDLVQRYFSNGKLAYSQSLNSDGSKVTDTYTSAGIKVTEVSASAASTTTDQYDASGILASEVVKASDGSVSTSVYTSGVKTKMYVAHADKTQDNYFYNITGQSYTSEHDHIKASGVLDTLTRMAADGSEQVRAYTPGLLISGSSGNDTFTGGGADTFSFSGSFGNDVIKNFNGGSSSIHDALQFAKSVAADFSQLSITQKGTATLVTAGSHGSVDLVNTLASSLNAGNVSFI